MKKAVVTGGAGFIGSHFVRRFLKTYPDWEVVNYDKLTYSGNPANLADLRENRRYQFIRGDICDSEALGKVCEGAEVIFHFAAETHVDRSIDNDESFIRTNVFGVRNLLDTVRRLRIPRLIHVSTDEVYGSIEKGWASEDSPLAPNSPYAASKAAGDLLVRAYQKTYGVPAIVVRSSNNFGPYQYPEKVIPLFITNLLEGKRVPLYAQGENRRDWIYVEDNCEAIELVFERGELGAAYNIGAGNEMSNRELTFKILKHFALGEDWIQSVPDRPGHDFRYALEASKIKRLGFQPRHSFEEALSQTVVWYREHPEWWQPLRKDKFTVKIP